MFTEEHKSKECYLQKIAWVQEKRMLSTDDSISAWRQKLSAEDSIVQKKSMLSTDGSISISTKEKNDIYRRQNTCKRKVISTEA